MNVTFSISQGFRTKTKKYCQETGIAFSELVRRAIDLYMGEHPTKAAKE